MKQHVQKLGLLFFVFTFMFAMYSCKQKEALTRVEGEKYQLIPQEGIPSEYQAKTMPEKEKKETIEEMNKIAMELENELDKEEPGEKAIKNKALIVKDKVKNILHHSNAADKKVTFKEKVKRSKFVLTHVNKINKLKKVFKEKESQGKFKLLTWILLALILLIVLALLGIDPITVLLLALLFLLLFILLMT